MVLRSSALEVLPETSAKVEALLAAVEETQVIKLDVPAGEDWADLVAEVSDLTPGERYCCVARSEEGLGSDPSASAKEGRWNTDTRGHVPTSLLITSMYSVQY